MSKNNYPSPSYKIIVLRNKGDDVIIPDSRDLNFIVDVFMRPKFVNSSISMREVTTTSIL